MEFVPLQITMVDTVGLIAAVANIFASFFAAVAFTIVLSLFLFSTRASRSRSLKVVVVIFCKICRNH